MSTKTTFKRVALVAVAALGLGVLSVAPSTATTNADSLTLSATTATQAIGDTKTATSAVATFQYLANSVNDSMSVTASLVSGPSTNAKLPIIALLETTSAQVVTTPVAVATAYSAANVRVPNVTSGATSAEIASNTAAYLVPLRDVTTAVAKAKFAVYMDAPAVAGTYVVKLTPAVTSGGGALASAAVTVTITVAATVTKPDTTSTAYIVAGAGVDPDGADSATVTAVKTVGTQAGTIVVTQKIAGVTTNAKESMTAVITGSGTLGAGSNSEAATGRALTVKYSDKVTIWSDGTSGNGVVTITGVDSGIVYKTSTVTFFDPTPASATVTVKKAYPAAGATTASAVYVTVKDSAGNIIKDAGIVLEPTSVGTGDTTTSCAFSATYSTNVCSITGLSTSKFGKVSYKAHVTGNDAAETEIFSSAFDVTFADTVATKVVVTGPATAQVGEKIKVTITATEKNGYPVADLTYEGAETSGRIFWNTTAASVPSYSSASFKPFNTGETITTLSGVATQEIYVPATAGTLTSTWTLAGTAGANVTTGAIDKTISGTTVTLKIAVASEALEAANAATTAALAANDAVDALAATVAKLVANLKAQITALTKLIVKIQKKVGA